MLLHEAPPPPDLDAAKQFYEVRGAFNEVQVWVHDKDPSADDQTSRALEWVELASAIHGM